MQYNHHAALVHTLCQRKKREKKRKINTRINSKNTASSSKQYFLLEYLVFFFKEPADKKNKKVRGKRWISYQVLP